ncbi:MAG: glycosyl hydrolase 108 family protein [Microvirga sp.]|jgi:lysozyme family protein
MADLFDACLAFTLAQEGGYVDDPADPGGATNMGITLATFQHWDHDPMLGPADVRGMTRQTAAAIYRALYWNALQGDLLPAGVDLSTFDFGVNAGTRRAAEMLQEVLEFPPDEVDGSVGPETLRAASKADATAVIRDLAERQTAYYRGLAEFDRFGRGWLDRTERRQQAALAMLRETPVA